MKRILLLLIVSVFFMGACSKSIQKVRVIDGFTVSMPRQIYEYPNFYNVKKGTPKTEYGIFKVPFYCKIEEVNNKYLARSGFTHMGNAYYLAAKPGTYLFEISYHKPGYRKVKMRLPLKIEAGHDYMTCYYLKENQVFFYIEDQTTNKVVTGKKYSK